MLVAWGPLGILALSAIEGIGVPTPAGTDILLLVVTAGRPYDWLFSSLMAIAGSLIGSTIFFEITRKGGEKFLARYTSSRRGRRFAEWFNCYGLVTVFITAFLPIPFMPFKAFSACAGALQVARARYFWVLAAARIPRYIILGYLGSKLGEASWPWVKAHTWHMVAVAVFLTGLLFWLVRMAERGRRSTIRVD